MLLLNFIILCILPFSFANIVSVKDVNDNQYDVIVFVSNVKGVMNGTFEKLFQAVFEFTKTNPLAFEEMCIVPYMNSKKRIIYSPVGPIDRDFDDSRRIYEAAKKGTEWAIKMKFDSPLLILGPLVGAPMDAIWMQDIYPILNALMGSLSALYTPIEIREAFPTNSSKFKRLGVFGASKEVVAYASAMEAGRAVSRDICGSDPERMSAPIIANHIQQIFKKADNIKIEVEPVERKKYPFTAAVNRASENINRHAGRIVRLKYNGPGKTKETIILVGKGVTFDSGGANIKVKNFMNGMHRDKCGAASVVGFFKTLALLQPQNIKVFGLMGFVRNSIGSDAYVPDEILTSLAGRRVRVVNTDAEGRMVLTDLLYYAKETALKQKKPTIISLATLTGHAKSTYKSYSAIIENEPAKKLQSALLIQNAGEKISDLFEISTIRREDYEIVEGESEYEDLMQSFHKSESEYARGHQLPVAYMIRASGLDEHGRNSKFPIPYTHMDIYPAIGGTNGPPTGVPIMALTVRFILPNSN